MSLPGNSKLRQMPRKSWTKEAVYADAAKYKTKSEWREKSNSAYVVSVRNKWNIEACAHMTPLRTPNGYWNSLKKCKAEAQRYSSRSEWQRKSPSCYRAASKNNWTEACTAHMPIRRRQNGYWTLTRCKEEAKKYKTKVEWRLKSYASYTKSIKEGWTAICCEHMTPNALWFGPSSILELLLSYDIRYSAEHRFKEYAEISRFPFDFYLPDFNLVIEFHGEQHRTGWARRASDAKGIQTRDLFKRDWIKRKRIHFLEIRQWEVADKEDIWTALLNKLQRINKNRKPILPMTRRDLTGLEMQKIRNRIKWPLLACQAEAKKYTTRKAWQTNSPSSYNAAFRKRWLEKCCAHMERLLKPKNYWTLERCKSDAKLYKSSGEWANAKGSGYSTARNRGWFKLCTPHMQDKRRISSKIIWTFEKCRDLARKCSSRAEFKNASASAYTRARVKGWLEDCCAHMKDHRASSTLIWTFEKCRDLAGNCSSRAEFKKSSASAYARARAKGWLEDCCAHMKN